MTRHEAPSTTSHQEQNPEHRIAFDAVFPDFILRDECELPASVRLHENGMLYDDEGAMYAVRRMVGGSGDEASPSQLFHGTKPSWHNATQGAGLYVANTKQAAMRASYVRERLPSAQYLIRVAPDAEVFDAHQPLRGLSARRKLAAATLRSLAVAPGMPWPTPKQYDALYGDADVIVFTPSAMQRRPGERIENTRLPQRFGLLRDLSHCEIVAVDYGR